MSQWCPGIWELEFSQLATSMPQPMLTLWPGLSLRVSLWSVLSCLLPLRSLCPQQQEGSSQNQTRLWHPCDFLKSSSSVLSLKSSAWPFIVCLVFLELCQALCCLRAFARRPPGGSHGLFWLWPKLHFLRPCLTTSYGTLGSTALIPFIVKPKSDFAHETLRDLSPPCPPLLPPPSHSSPPATLLLEHTVHDAPQGLCTGHSSAWMLSPVL